jgi:hypothetical protein
MKLAPQLRALDPICNLRLQSPVIYGQIGIIAQERETDEKAETRCAQSRDPRTREAIRQSHG